jgi:DNA modification methylase
MHDTPSPWRSRIVAHTAADPHSLIPHPENWRTHPAIQAAAMRGVLDEIGWVQTVVVNERTGRLIDGHLRVMLALERGMAEIPVTVVDLSESEERAVLATFDPLGAMAEADGTAVAELLQTVDTANAEIAGLLDRLARESQAALPSFTDPDDLPPPPLTPTSRNGDVWLLGAHTVVCGDARDPAALQAATRGEPAQWMWTDPPFGVNYQGKTRDRLTLANDQPEGLAELLEGAFRAVDGVLADGAAVYVAHPAGALSHCFATAFLDVGWTWHQNLIWQKDAFVLGHSDYHYQHEEILYGGKGRKPAWRGDRAQSSLFAVPRPRRNPDHPTAKPVALIEAQLRNSSRHGDRGLDPFLGSGSTLIAAARLGRRCAGIECDPRYVDVTVRRWQAWSGAEAALDAEGRTFAEVTGARHGR